MCGRCAAPLIVGYQTIPEISASQYIALGTVFEDVAGGEIAVKDVVKVGVPAGGGSLSSGTDQIWRWNTETASWTKYFWYSSRGTTLWAKQGEKVETTDKIPAGETFFFLRSGAGTVTSLTLAGAVKPMEGSVSASASAWEKSIVDRKLSTIFGLSHAAA